MKTNSRILPSNITNHHTRQFTNLPKPNGAGDSAGRKLQIVASDAGGLEDEVQIDWVALASALDLPAHRHQSVAKFIALSVKEKIARSNWAGEARNRGRFTDFESTVHETIALLESLRMFVYEHFLTELGRDKRLDSIFVGLSEHVYNLTDRLYPEWEASLQGGMV